MSKYLIKYQGKYIKSGNTYTVDVEQIPAYPDVNAAETVITNQGSGGVVDNGTDFDITGAVGFGGNVNTNTSVGERIKCTFTISGLTVKTGTISFKLTNNAGGSGSTKTTTHTVLLDRNGDYELYVIGTSTNPTTFARFDCSVSTNFNIADIVVSSGTVESITTISKLMPNPVQLKQRGAGRNKTQIINGSELEFNFYSTAADAGQFDSIFSADWKDYRISYYRDSTLIWQGYVLNDNFSKEFVATQYEIQLNAADGLATLKDIPYRDPDLNTVYEDRVLGIKIISRCLEHLGIDLDIKAQINTIHNTLMTTSECVFNKVTHDNQRFIKVNDAREEVLSCHTVLEEILKLYSCRLSQIEGNWWIIADNETDSNLYTYTWLLLSESTTSTNDLELDITAYDYKNKGNESVVQPIATHEVTFQDFNLGSTDITNGDFSSGTANWDKNDFQSFGAALNVATVTSCKSGCGTPDAGTNLKLESDTFQLDPTGEDQIIVKFSVRLATLSPSDQDFAPFFDMRLYKGGVQITATDFQSTQFTLNSDFATYTRTYPVNASGNDYTIALTISEGANLWDLALVNIKDIKTKFVFADGSDDTFDKVYATQNTDTSSKEVAESIIVFGDSEKDDDAGRLKIGATGTSNWKRFGKTETLKLANIRGLIDVVDRATYKKYINITVMDVNDNIRPYHRIKINSETFRINSYTKNHYNRRTDLELEELLTTDPTNVLTIFPLSTQDGGATQGGSSASFFTGVVINDSVTNTTSVWSSSKIDTTKEDNIPAQTFEPWDTDIVKADVAETIGANWTWGSNTVTAGNFIDASDFHLKKNIKPLPVDAFMKIRPVEYELIKGGGKHFGVIAQHLERVLPDSVKKGEDGYLGVTYRDLFMLTLAKVQEHERLLKKRSFWQWLKFKIYG